MSNPVENVRRSDEEELVNAATHGLGCIVAAIASTYVLVTQVFSSSATRIGFCVYAIALVFLFAMSTLSHMVQEPKRLTLARSWDQGAIYLLIAGTYTPGIIAFCAKTNAIGLLAFVWIMATYGFYYKVIAKKQVNSITTATYLALGWGPAMFLIGNVTQEYFLWLLAGGVLYSIGVVFLINDRRVKFFHAAWHLWVIAAAATHFFAICMMAI